MNNIEQRLTNLEKQMATLIKSVSNQNKMNGYDFDAERKNTSDLSIKTDTNTSDIADTKDYIDVIMTEVIPSLMGMDSDM